MVPDSIVCGPICNSESRCMIHVLLILPGHKSVQTLNRELDEDGHIKAHLSRRVHVRTLKGLVNQHTVLSTPALAAHTIRFAGPFMAEDTRGGPLKRERQEKFERCVCGLAAPGTQ